VAYARSLVTVGVSGLGGVDIALFLLDSTCA